MRALVLGIAIVLWSAVPVAAADRVDPELGRTLYVNSCSSCHGVNGLGTEFGPPLVLSGAAAADFMLSTGRMPLDDPQSQPVRKPPAFDEREIEAIVQYVALLGRDGIPVPHVDADQGDLSLGWELYSASCEACHGSAGNGGTVGAGLEAPALSEATPTVIVEAMRIGPGTMPVFPESLIDEEGANSVARYLLFLRDEPTPGGLGLSRVGPIIEGAVAWLIGVALLLGISKWLGEKG